MMTVASKSNEKKRQKPNLCGSGWMPIVAIVLILVIVVVLMKNDDDHDLSSIITR